MHPQSTASHPTCPPRDATPPSGTIAGLLTGLLCLAGCPYAEPQALTQGPEGGTDASTTTTGATGATGDTDDAQPTTGLEPGPADSPCVEIRDAARTVLKTHCSACHTGPMATKFDYVDDLDALITNGKVAGGDPEASLLYQKVKIGAMPQGAPPLDAAAQAALYDWIEQCTVPSVSDPLDPPKCLGKNAFISTDQMLNAMLSGINDFNNIEPEDQPFIRFFTLTHLWNAGFCDAQLDAHRHALAKLLNSLSDEGKIRVPEPVDPERTIYRFDLRDYTWDKDLWELLVSENEFAVQYTQAKAVQLQKLTGTDVPFQWADWFVTDASEAPLYDRVLFEGVLKVVPDVLNPVAPMTRFDLEQNLGIDVQANIDDEVANNTDSTSRAGFQFSGVSEQNRVIERHEIPGSFNRAYWLSYDFLTEVELGNIFYHPLDFAADGGEIIFNLANGLQAYLLINKEGQRIDEADQDVVNNKEEGGDAIKNGRSCMGCHYQGMRLIDDEIRGFVEAQIGVFDAQTILQVQHLYPPIEEFAEVLAQDGDVFMSQLLKTGAPLLIAGKEVVSAVYRAFEDPYIDESRAAAELGITTQALVPKIGLLPQGLQMLNGGVVSRETMRDQYAIAICNLKLGITKACKPG
jgi:hypothetical protein